MTNTQLVAELEKRFPWLTNEDEDANGGDTVDALAAWHKLLKRKAVVERMVCLSANGREAKGGHNIA